MQPGELEKLLASLETCPIQKKGLVWRLLKLYWKKLLFIAFCWCCPVAFSFSFSALLSGPSTGSVK
jgi:hypothetical protein